MALNKTIKKPGWNPNSHDLNIDTAVRLSGSVSRSGNDLELVPVYDVGLHVLGCRVLILRFCTIFIARSKLGAVLLYLCP